MRTRTSYLCLSSFLLLALAAGAGLVLAPGLLLPTTSRAASMSSLPDPEPQRFALAQAVAVLPGGASSLDETYEDWRVSCVLQGDGKRCALSQIQAQQNGQRMLAIEFAAPRENKVTGTLVLPFGLALDSGVRFQVDEQAALEPVRFRTCLPVGCLVPLVFDGAMAEALRAGAVLNVKAIADGGTEIPFTISLKGFATALDRTSVLAN
ncbi:UNVERIFIED_ORG: invasion associated locus B family protein (plasmid) [Roseateles sp. XES5]|nr:invasion associated locus B family protein [Roseateles sp. XES5]